MPVASTSKVAPASTSRSAPPKSSDPYANYSTAESLGFVDEEAERLAAEKAIRLNEGRIGEWTTVAVQLPPASSSDPALVASASPPPPPVVDEDDVRGWKLEGTKRRRIAVGLGDIYDPGEIKVKKKEGETPPPLEIKAEEDPAGSGATAVPQWTPRGWLKPGEAPPKTAATAVVKMEELPSDTKPLPKPEDESPPSTVLEPPVPVPNKEELAPVKVEEPEVVQADVPSTALFRKRKAPASGAGGRGSRR